jgi:PIN domain nuclease of toxin-antitoxin system
VNYLLDTHVWLWWLLRPERIRREVVRLIADAANTIYVSTVSSWEIAIKISIGKLRLPEAMEKAIPDSLAVDSMATLVLEHRHCFELATLPLHHRDPFDRMLIAQARVQGWPVITADPEFDHYDVEVIKAS